MDSRPHFGPTAIAPLIPKLSVRPTDHAARNPHLGDYAGWALRGAAIEGTTGRTAGSVGFRAVRTAKRQRECLRPRHRHRSRRRHLHRRAAAEQQAISRPTIPAFQAAAGTLANAKAAQARPTPRTRLVHSSPGLNTSLLIFISNPAPTQPIRVGVARCSENGAVARCSLFYAGIFRAVPRSSAIGRNTCIG